MGKCVSKGTLTHHGNLRLNNHEDVLCHESEGDEISYIYNDNNNLSGAENDEEGQTESKRSTKVKGPETKGTAMSFGFKKKSLPVYTGTTKKIFVKDKEKNQINDDNGNTGGSMDSVHDNSSCNSNNNRLRLKPPTKSKDATASNNVRSNRFGFRNTVRPASVGPQPKHTDVYADDDDDNSTASNSQQQNKNENNLNNNSHGKDVVGVGVKKRSKSAAATTRNTVVSFNETVMVQPVPVERDRRSLTSLKSNNQSTPPVSLNKYTLYSGSLPKPQQPIPIQVRPTMDTKDVKHAMNLSRRQFFGLTSDSSDSGIVSDDTRCQSSGRNLHRNRNLEMVLNGRHTFEVRDLEKLNTAPVVPLPLPRLPSVFRDNNYQPAPIGDLVRSDDDNRNNENVRQTSLESLETTESSTEEEKLIKDNNSSEKSILIQNNLNNKMTYLREQSVSSKNSSPGSSRHSWCNAGESMAPKDCISSISISSDDTGVGTTSKSNHIENMIRRNNSIDEETVDDIDISSVTCETTNSISGPLSLDLKHSTAYIQDNKEIENKEATKEEAKFAEIAATLENANLLYDETSPTDSLASSSSESENAKKQKRQKTLAECLAEKDQKDLEDISPELEAVSPLTPGTPTHASNSLSLSDVGRDFLIDDEIADQPALLFNDDAPSQGLGLSENLAGSHTTDTPTLRDSIRSSTHKTPTRKIMTAYESPASIRRPRISLSRSGSLDTLSPCESIASDDLMVDFETRSSMDSIECQNMASSSGISARNSSDGLPGIWQELEQKTGDMIKDWHKLIRANRHSSRESITSQLPARTTRLLNRRLQNNSQSPSYNGSDSPRSIDSFHRRTPNKPSPLLQRSTEDIDLIDKAMKNSLLQEVSSVKKELLRLRRVLQDEDFSLEMSDTLNPFDTNGQINPVVLDENRRIDALSQESGQLTLMEDQRQELGDLRRQVVYLQSQIDDRDRKIRIQQNQITKYESTVQNPTQTSMLSNSNIRSMSSDTSTSGMGHSVETVSTATQTERLRPISMGPDHVSSVSSRSELPVPVLKLTRPSSNNTNNNPQQHQNTIVVQQQTPAFLKQTQVSSIYTKLSSIKPTTTNSLNNNNNNHTNKLNSYKTVRTTQIGNVMPSKIAANVANHNLNHNNNNKLTLNGKLSNHKSSPELRMMNGTRIGIYGTGAK